MTASACGAARAGRSSRVLLPVAVGVQIGSRRRSVLSWGGGGVGRPAPPRGRG